MSNLDAGQGHGYCETAYRETPPWDIGAATVACLERMEHL